MAVPDLGHFEVRVTARKEQPRAGHGGTFFIGVMPKATVVPSREQMLDVRSSVKIWCEKHNAMLISSGDFRLYPSGTQIFGGESHHFAKGHTLAMRFSRGTLEFQQHGACDWVKAGEGLPAACLPVIVISFQDHPLHVAVSKKRGRPEAAKPCTVGSQLWAEREFADGLMECEGRQFPVHRAVVCAASPVLKAAFSGGMAEARKAEYTINDSTPEAVELMLRYTYTRALPEDGKGEEQAAVLGPHLAALLELAVRYELPGLCEQLAWRFAEGLTPENVRARAKVLKLHRDHDPHLSSAWESMLDKVSQNRAVLAAALV